MLGDVAVDLAVAEDPIARDVGAQVEILGELGQARAARLGHREQRTRLGILLAEAGELVGVGRRQNGDVGLDAASGQPARLAVISTAANSAPDLDGVRGIPFEVRSLSGLDRATCGHVRGLLRQVKGIIRL